jgi:hypothetical protein
MINTNSEKYVRHMMTALPRKQRTRLKKMIITVLTCICSLFTLYAGEWEKIYAWPEMKDSTVISLYQQKGCKAEQKYDSKMSYPKGKGVQVVSIHGIPENSKAWNLQLGFRSKSAVTAGKKYRLRYWIRASKKSKVSVALYGSVRGRWQCLSPKSSHKAALDTKWQQIQIDSDMPVKPEKMDIPRLMIASLPAGTVLYISGIILEGNTLEPDFAILKAVKIKNQIKRETGPALYSSSGSKLIVTREIKNKFTSFTVFPKTLAKRGNTDIRMQVKKGRNFIVADLGEEKKINYVELKKHFWPHRTPTDISVSIYTGSRKKIKDVIKAQAWKTVSAKKESFNRLQKIFRFKEKHARFIKITVHKAYQNNPLADLNKIILAYIPSVSVPAPKIRTEPGKIILSWKDIRKKEFVPSPSAETISWAFSEGHGYYQVYRSCNPDDGFRIVNLNGEVTGTSFTDEQIVPGQRYQYKVRFLKNNIIYGESKAVFVTAPSGQRPVVEQGLWQSSAGRMSLDENVYYNDQISTHGNLGGYTTCIRDRMLYLVYPTLPHIETWPKGLAFEGNLQSKKLNGSLILGTVSIPGTEHEDPVYTIKYSGWESMVYTMTYKDKKFLTVFMNGLVPALTFQSDAKTLRLFGTSPVVKTRVPSFAYAEINGKVTRIPFNKVTKLQNMSASWILFYYGDGNASGDKNIDLPQLVILSKKPQYISSSEKGYDFSFASQAGYISCMPLYGVKKISTASWQKGPSAEAITRIRYWEKRLKRIPVTCRDTFSIEEEKNRIKVTQKYRYINTDCAWDIKAVPLAPVQPTTMFAKMKGYPVSFQTKMIDQKFSTYSGPYFAAEGVDRIVYYLPADIDALLQPYEYKLIHPEMKDYVASRLPAEEIVQFKLDHPSKKLVKWRPRLIDLEVQQYIHAIPFLKQESRKKVYTIVKRFLDKNKYFDLSTYYYMRDRYSGKKYIISDDPYCRFSHTVDYGFGTGSALYTIYKWAENFNNWDEIKSHWDSIMQYGTVFEAGNDWNHQTPDAMTFYNEAGNNPDYLMSYLQGHIALIRMSKKIGDELTYRRNVYMFSKTFIMYMAFFNIQSWAYEHRPHYTKKGKKDRPMKGFTYAPYLRGDGVVNKFINTDKSITAQMYYPFVRTCPEIAVFWDKYMRDSMAHYIYQQLPAMVPYSIDGHVLLARSYLFEKDVKTINRWIDHACINNGDWGNDNNFLIFSTLLFAPPNEIKAAPGEYINAQYEKRIQETVPDTQILDVKKIRISSEKAKMLKPVWEIGVSDNSGKEFSSDNLGPKSKLAFLKKQYPDLGKKELRNKAKYLKHDILFLKKMIDDYDSFVYNPEIHTEKDWRYTQYSAWRVLGGGANYNGRHHPQAIEFNFKPDANKTYYLVIDIHRLRSLYPLFITLEVNGKGMAVRLPLPPYAGYKMPKYGLEAKDGEYVIAFPVKGSLLKKGKNRFVIHAEGSVALNYDWLGFGEF